MEAHRELMVKLLTPLLPKEQFFETAIRGVNLFRIDKSYPRVPKAYNPRIIIMAQGQKRVFIGEETFTYDPSHYLVLSVPMPLDCEAIAKPGKPILGFFIDVDPAEVGEILLEMDEARYSGDSLPRGIYGAPMTQAISDASIRLLSTLSSRTESRVLGRMVVREIIYRVLMGENGGALQALAYRNRRFFQIAHVLNKIHQAYNEEMDVKTLAMDLGMSVSTFHTSFKAVTNVSPIQYVKNVRLHRARILMAQEGLNAISAAQRVGYESPSQFSREYKRYFGMSPAKDSVSSRIAKTAQVA